MYCGNCGKQLSGQEAFCPNCGAANPGTVQTAAAAGSSTGSTKAAGKLDALRITLIVLGALHVLAFFGLPYAKLSGLGILLSFALPERLTAMSYIALTLNAAGNDLIDGGVLVLNVVSCLLPLLLGLGVIVTNVRRKGYAGSLILGVCLLLVYLFLGAAFGEMSSNGYTMTSGSVLACVMAVLTIAASVAGLLTGSKK